MSLTIYRADGTLKTTAASGLSVLMDAWHVVGAAGEPGFQNGWVNAGGSSPVAAYRKDPLGKVQLRGAVMNGTNGSVVFTLPSTYRPSSRVSFPLMTTGSLLVAGWAQVYPTGEVWVGSAGSTAFMPLDVIEFDTDTVTAMPTGPQGPQGPTGATGGNATILLDIWHTIGAVGEPAFATGWVNYGGGYQLAQYRKDPTGRVWLRGLVSRISGTGTTMFTLPAGYRPSSAALSQSLVHPETGGGAFAEIRFDTGGNILFQSGNPSYVSIDGLSFDTDSVTAMPSGPQGPKGDTGGNATVPFEAAHAIGAAGEPAFTNSWTNDTGQVARFRKDPLGKVYLDGAIKGGASGTVAFVLPVGYRPPAGKQAMAFTVYGSGGHGAAVVDPNGGVALYSLTANVTTWVYLDTIRFDTELVTQMPTGPAGPQGPPGNSVTVLMDTWHTVGAAGEPAFVAPWGYYEPIQFRKNPLGKVQIRGLAFTSGSSFTYDATIFQLPVGYRPLGNSRTACELTNPDSSKAMIQVIIYPDGTVRPLIAISGTPSRAAGTYLNLGEIEFDTDSVTQMPVGPQGPPGPSTPIQRVTSLPALVYDGLEVYWQVQAGPPTVVWHMRFNGTTNKWECIAGPPITFFMEGQNPGLVNFASGTNITVNAAQNVALQWNLFAPIDLWAEVEFHIGYVQKIDANYNYVVFTTMVTPAPAAGVPPALLKTQHASVQQYEPYIIRSLLGLSAGVSYAIYCQTSVSGGTWQYNQSATYLHLIGKAWPR